MAKDVTVIAGSSKFQVAVAELQYAKEKQRRDGEGIVRKEGNLRVSTIGTTNVTLTYGLHASSGPSSFSPSTATRMFRIARARILSAGAGTAVRAPPGPPRALAPAAWRRRFAAPLAISAKRASRPSGTAAAEGFTFGLEAAAAVGFGAEGAEGGAIGGAIGGASGAAAAAASEEADSASAADFFLREDDLLGVDAGSDDDAAAAAAAGSFATDLRERGLFSSSSSAGGDTFSKSSSSSSADSATALDSWPKQLSYSRPVWQPSLAPAAHLILHLLPVVRLLISLPN